MLEVIRFADSNHTRNLLCSEPERGLSSGARMTARGQPGTKDGHQLKIPRKAYSLQDGFFEKVEPECPRGCRV